MRRVSAPPSDRPLLGGLLLGGLLVAAVLASGPALAEDEPGFDALMRDARAALAIADHPRASALVKQAISRADEPEGGPRSARARLLEGQIAIEQKRYRTAERAFRKAAQLAGADEVARRNALARRRAAALEGKLTARVEVVDRILAHDRTVLQAERQPGVGAKRRDEVRAKIAEAAAAYRADRDPHRAHWAEAVRALVAVRSGALEEGHAEASRVLELLGEHHAPPPGESAPRAAPSRAREVALDAASRAAQALGRLEDAARSALALNAIRAERAPPAKRRWSRMRGLDELCRKLDDATRAGACARLEREVTGTYTFTNHALGRPRRELADADLERAHAQILPAIEDCVLTAARAHPDRFDGTDVEIAWSIQPNGVTSDLEITPKRYLEELAPCVTERLSWARYPRYTSGERKTVAIPYHLGRSP